jgi:hypothetical protein
MCKVLLLSALEDTDQGEDYAVSSRHVFLG